MAETQRVSKRPFFWTSENVPTSASGEISAEARARLGHALGLSPRELAIALKVIDGCTTSQVAMALGCSPHTVDSHLRRIFAKLGVANRVSMATRVLLAYAQINSSDPKGVPESRDP